MKTPCANPSLTPSVRAKRGQNTVAQDQKLILRQIRGQAITPLLPAQPPLMRDCALGGLPTVWRPRSPVVFGRAP